MFIIAIAAHAAPNPLSIFTATTLGAQLARADCKATVPPALTP